MAQARLESDNTASDGLQCITSFRWVAMQLHLWIEYTSRGVKLGCCHDELISQKDKVVLGFVQCWD